MNSSVQQALLQLQKCVKRRFVVRSIDSDHFHLEFLDELRNCNDLKESFIVMDDPPLLLNKSDESKSTVLDDDIGDRSLIEAKKSYHYALTLELSNQRSSEENSARFFLQNYSEKCLSSSVGVSMLPYIENGVACGALITLMSNSETCTIDMKDSFKSKESDSRKKSEWDHVLALAFTYGVIGMCPSTVHNSDPVLSDFMHHTREELLMHQKLTRVNHGGHDIVSQQFMQGSNSIVFYAPSLKRELSEDDMIPVLSLAEQPISDGRIIRLVYPGSFNPLHLGHVKLIQAAYQITRRNHPQSIILSIFELSADNVDKPSLDEHEIRRRLDQFNIENSMMSRSEIAHLLLESNFENMLVALTRAPLFLMKAKLLPGSTFVIGMDTATRLIDPRYYENSFEKMMDALALFNELQCTFLVAGRQKQKDDNDKSFQTISDLELDKIGQFKALFFGIPEEDFRVDLSSSDIRNFALQ